MSSCPQLDPKRNQLGQFGSPCTQGVANQMASAEACWALVLLLRLVRNRLRDLRTVVVRPSCWSRHRRLYGNRKLHIRNRLLVNLNRKSEVQNRFLRRRNRNSADWNQTGARRNRRFTAGFLHRHHHGQYNEFLTIAAHHFLTSRQPH